MSDSQLRFDRVGVPGADGAPALGAFDLVVARGESLALLGPAGAGKSLVLHVVAGLARPSSGTLLIGGRHHAETPPHKRDIALIEREPALFQSMTAAENIGFPLRLRRVPRGRPRAARAADAARDRARAVPGRAAPGGARPG